MNLSLITVSRRSNSLEAIKTSKHTEFPLFLCRDVAINEGRILGDFFTKLVA